MVITGMDEDNSETKEKAIAELNKMLSAWRPNYCRYLLREAERMHEVATASPAPKNEKGKEFCEYVRVHARDETTQVALCRHKRADQLVSTEKFAELPPQYKCASCEAAIRKLKGEETLVGIRRYNWLRNTQKELLIAIFLASGRKTGQWCTTTELFPITKYKNRESLRNALRSLRRRDLIEIQQKGNLCHVRLTFDCIERTRKGDFCVSIGEIV